MEDIASGVSSFFNAIQSNPRIGAVHIAVYMALYYKGLPNLDHCIHAYAKEIMPIAKIGSRMTYCRVMNDLKESGFLKYQPSFSNKKASKIWLR